MKHCNKTSNIIVCILFVVITFLFIVSKGHDFYQTCWLLKEPFGGCKLFLHRKDAFCTSRCNGLHKLKVAEGMLNTV